MSITSTSNLHLSQHFLLKEFQVTNQKLNNDIPKELIGKAVFLAMKMEQVRKLLGSNPITINSAYRSPAVNKAVGGVANSQHALMEAVDFTCHKFGTPYDVAKVLAAKFGELNYDQLIYEQTWVHISFTNDKTPRGQNLTMKNGKYTAGINK